MDIGVAILGAGRIGRLHARNLTSRLRGVRVVGIADPHLEAARATAAACGIARAVPDPLALIGDAAVDAVVICSSTDTHAPLLEAAAAARKHVFCEKPLDLDPHRIEGALRAAARSGILVQVGFNRRFDPTFRRLAERVRAGDVGTPHLVRITSRDPAPPPIEYVRVSGGLFLDMTIHDLDLARWVVQDEVVEVYAAGAALVDPEIGRAGDIDTALVTLRFAGGALCAIDNSRRAVYGYDQRLEVFGSNGCLVADNPPVTQVRAYRSDGVGSDRLQSFFLDRYAESYCDEMAAFLDAVRGDLELPVTGHDGLRAVLLALACRKSLAENRPVRPEAAAQGLAA